MDPDFYSTNLLMLGKTYLALKDKDKALFWLAKARDYPGRTHEDKEVQQQQQKNKASHFLLHSGGAEAPLS